MAVYSGPNIVEDGLVLHLDAANSKSYPGSGNTWSSIINNINFSLINGATFNSNRLGTISFDGTNDFIRTYDSKLNIGTGDFTIEIWFYWNAQNFENEVGMKKVMGTKSSPAVGYEIWISDVIDLFGGLPYYVSTALVFRYGNNSVGGDLYNVDTIKPQQNGWNHALITRLNGVISVYLNEILVGTPVTTSFDMNNNDNVYVIGGNNAGTENFKGNVSVVKQYTKGFSIQEVQQNFNALRGRFGI